MFRLEESRRTSCVVLFDVLVWDVHDCWPSKRFRRLV